MADNEKQGRDKKECGKMLMELKVFPFHQKTKIKFCFPCGNCWPASAAETDRQTDDCLSNHTHFLHGTQRSILFGRSQN